MLRIWSLKRLQRIHCKMRHHLFLSTNWSNSSHQTFQHQTGRSAFRISLLVPEKINNGLRSIEWSTSSKNPQSWLWSSPISYQVRIPIFQEFQPLIGIKQKPSKEKSNEKWDKHKEKEIYLTRNISHTQGRDFNP